MVRRIYGLTDDMVLAKNEREIRSMIEVRRIFRKKRTGIKYGR